VLQAQCNKVNTLSLSSPLTNLQSITLAEKNRQTD